MPPVAEGNFRDLSHHVSVILDFVTPGQLVRETRARHGLSQERLARRVGTRQSAISRLEADDVSPSVETLELLMRAMGERLEIGGVEPPRDYDPLHLQATRTRSPGERLALGISWNRMAGVSPPPVGRPMPETDASVDAERILRQLAEHGVDYVLAGGLAAYVHGSSSRTASVIDLIPAPQPANLKRLAAALRAMEARVLNPGQEGAEIDARMLPKATIWQFATRDGGIDVLHEVPGGRPYEDLSARALRVTLGDIEVPVVDLDDLIEMKLARGRPVDLADVAALTDDGSGTRGE